MEITLRGSGGFGILAPPQRLRSALSRSNWNRSHPHKKNRLPSCVFFAFCRSDWAARARFWDARTLPGSIWEAEMPRILTFFAACTRSLLTSCEANKTLQ